MTYPTQACRGCGQAMIWTTSPRGRPLPLDARPSSTIPGLKMPTGLYSIEVDLVTGEHKAVSVGRIGNDSYVSHFATCEARDRFKGRTR